MGYKTYTREKNIERFWSLVNKTDYGDCWMFGERNDVKHAYYGCIHLEGKRHNAHVASWKIHFGDIPAGMRVLHKCDTPGCVRPDHLFLGTAKQNTQDCIQKGRFKFLTPRTGADHPTSKLTEAEVVMIKQEYRKRSGGQRGSHALREIAEEFNIDRTQVWHIVTGRQWKHIP